MPRIIDNYSLNEQIGEGVYGKVYKAVHIKNKQEFAVKVVSVQRFKDNPKLEQCTVNEINTLSSIETSPHIVRYIEMLKTNNNFYFVYEFCNGGTLEKLLKQQTRLPETKAMQYFKQLVEAFRVLNKHNIMHRDLKPDNILFHDGVLKLGDFGFCKSPEKDMASTMLGSPIYMAPEVLKGEIYTSKADIWSLGVVLFEMLFGYCPFESNSIAKLISVLEENELRIPLQSNPISPQTQTLLKRLLTKDHFRRVDWQTVFSMVDSEKPALLEQPNSLNVPDDRLRHSLGNLPEWDFQKDAGFKKASSSSSTTHSSNTPTLSVSSKINSATALEPVRSYQNKQYKPSNFESSPSKPGYYVTSSDSIKRTTPVPTSPTLPSYKRKNILDQHSFCLRGIKTSIDFIRSQDRDSMAYSFLLLKKSQQRLRKICEQINITEIEYEDIIFAINNELKQLERQVSNVKDELVCAGCDLKAITDGKRYLQGKFRENDPNLRVWFEMVNFLYGERGASSKDMSNIEMCVSIKNRLA